MRGYKESLRPEYERRRMIVNAARNATSAAGPSSMWAVWIIVFAIVLGVLLGYAA